MPAITQQSSPVVTTKRLQLLLNFCRVVVRSDDTHLQVAMDEYKRSLAQTHAMPARR